MVWGTRGTRGAGSDIFLCSHSWSTVWAQPLRVSDRDRAVGCPTDPLVPQELLQEVDTELCMALEQPQRAGSICVGTRHRRVCRWEPRTILHRTKQLLILFLCCGRSVPYNSQGGSYRERDIRHGKGKSPSLAARGRQGWGG